LLDPPAGPMIAATSREPPMPKSVKRSHHPWADVAAPAARVDLILDGAASGTGDKPMEDLSAAVRVGSTLYLGSDEGISLERLRWDGERFASHSRLSLADLLGLDAEAGEADIEGLAVDEGWLWVLGSHARTRPKIEGRPGERIDAKAFCELKDTRARCLLARLPLDGEEIAAEASDRKAGLLKLGKHGNALAEALRDDPLIGPFTKIAAKEGGVDLEGIAVAGDRVAIGMRGPVIRSCAVLLEMRVAAKGSGKLKLEDGLVKRLLDLDGLGIRDLKRLGGDLLILAGPTTALDGPVAVYRWRGWLTEEPEDDDMVCLHRPDRIIELPFGRGDDHPEGLALLDGPDGAKRLLVVNDGPSKPRLDPARHAVTCDAFDIPD
jgi:hypothetical protein